MEYSIKPKRLGERRIIHYPQKRIIGLYVSKNEKKVIGMALMCALTMLQVTDVSAAEIAKGDVITIESIKTSTDKVASNYSTNSDMLLSRIVQEGMVPTSKRSNVIHEDDLVITETEITYQQLFPTSLTSSMISAQAKAAGYKTGFSFHIYEVSSS